MIRQREQMRTHDRSDDTTSKTTEPPGSFLGGSVRWGERGRSKREWLALAMLLVVCVVTRVATTIHYVEDPDSLHFALSMVEFDVGKLQPHFPGYMVFVGMARLFDSVTGSFALSFSLVGSIATFLLVTGLLSLARWPLLSMRGMLLAALVVGNGMVWVYGNRYMPDLLGASLLVWTVHDLASDSDRLHIRGAFVAALLAGTRLSYLPFLLPFGLYALTWKRGRVASIAAFIVGVALWAVPLVLLTGWSDLVAIGSNQTAGHFDEFGGTIRTEPDLLLRFARMLEGTWTDILEGYWPERTFITIVSGAGALVGLVFALRSLPAFMRQRRWQLVGAGIAGYLVWIFLYQNVIHHSRHLLPLAGFIILAVAYGLWKLVTTGWIGRSAVAIVLLAWVAIGAGLGAQHRRPSAIAQASSFLSKIDEPLTVLSTGLVNDYLSATGVRARFIDVASPSVRDSLAMSRGGERVVSVGDYRSQVSARSRPVERFYHNPYVNRIWPVIELYEFDLSEHQP